MPPASWLLPTIARMSRQSVTSDGGLAEGRLRELEAVRLGDDLAQEHGASPLEHAHGLDVGDLPQDAPIRCRLGEPGRWPGRRRALGGVRLGDRATMRVLREVAA